VVSPHLTGNNSSLIEIFEVCSGGQASVPVMKCNISFVCVSYRGWPGPPREILLGGSKPIWVPNTCKIILISLNFYLFQNNCASNFNKNCLVTDHTKHCAKTYWYSGNV